MSHNLQHRPRILLASLTNVARDARMIRQASALQDFADIACMGIGDSDISGVETTVLKGIDHNRSWMDRVNNISLKVRKQFGKYYWSRRWVIDTKRTLEKSSFDAVIVNDIPLLPVTISVAGSRPVIFDAHEYYPLVDEGSIRFRLLQMPYLYYLCKTYIPQAAACMTVSPGLAERYEQECGIRPTVVRNVPPYQKLDRSRTKEDEVHLVYHGNARGDRGISRLFALMKHLDERFHLHFYVKPVGRCATDLERRSRGQKRIHWHEFLPIHEVCGTINQHDLELIHYVPSSFNLKCCLPNKFFEAVQARLGIVVGPSPDMARLVREHELGVVTDDYSIESLARQLNSVTPSDIRRFKASADETAKELCWERESAILKRLISSVVPQSHSAAMIHQ